MRDAAPLWAELVSNYHLAEPSLARLTSPWPG